MVQITLPNSEILEAELADNYFKRNEGLSGCKDKKCMLFTMPFSAKWPFWMPAMHYAIKIIYLNKEKEIVDIKEATPLTKHPKTWKIYKPKKACKYALETPFEHNIKIGDKLNF